MCVTKGCICWFHNNGQYKLKGTSKRDKHVTQNRQFGYIAKRLKETMPLLYNQICTCQCGVEEESKQVLEMQYGRITHIKVHKAKYNDLVQIMLKASLGIIWLIE